jgi:hypothetical protein
MLRERQTDRQTETERDPETLVCAHKYIMSMLSVV